MRAVILAAGQGSRIRLFSKGKPKCLIRLLGLTIMERILYACRGAGVREFLIVLGFEGERIKRFLGDGSRLGVKITYIPCPDWEKGNGVSLYAARRYLRRGERFLVLMSDHLLQPELLQSFMREAKGQRRSLMGYDTKLDEIPNLKEATKVRIGSRREILGAGKGLRRYKGVDCGVFAFTPLIFKCLEEAFASNRFTLSDGLSYLIRRRAIKGFHIGEFYWQDIDSRLDLGIARYKILNQLNTGREGWVSRIINRRFSNQITKRLINYNISPNMVSISSFLVGIVSAILFILKMPFSAGLIAQFSSILDGVDGELARAKFQVSPYGGYMDSILDRYADLFLIFGMSTYVYSQQPSATVLLISFLALMGAPMSMLCKEKFYSAFGVPFVPDQMDGWTRYLPANRDGRLFIIMVSGILNQVLYGLLALGIITNFQTLYRLFSAKRMKLKTTD